MSATMVHLALIPDVVVLSSVVGKVDRSSCWCYVFVAMCLVFLINQKFCFFSELFVLFIYVSSHIGHFVSWILLERCTAVRCRSLNDFAVSTEVNNWPKRWVFSSDTLRLATWRIGWWWVVSQVFYLVDDFCKKKNVIWNHPDKPQKWCFGVWKR